MIKLYNFLSKTKEEFKPVNPGKVGMYVCGPTVYGHCHLGHARGYVSVDILRRYFEYSGYEVRHIMNYTDVGHLVENAEVGEDKIEKIAKAEKVDPVEIADRYIESCKEDFEALNIKPAHFNPRPTKYIAQIIKFVEELIKKRYAYEVNGSVYFSVEKFLGYGKLSGKKKEDLIAGARVEENPEKKNPLDFALWIKAPKDHILKWESPWGTGYPGWHIECSVMSLDLLGQDTFDIHEGGLENAFPHNENEIAQSESYLGKPMARFWVLWNNVVVNGRKMSKSLGNFTTIKDALNNYDPSVIRLWILSSHYRSVINFSGDSLEQAKTNFERISNFVNFLKNTDLEARLLSDIKLGDYQKKFGDSMNDDLNTPLALSVLYELITETNKLIQANEVPTDSRDSDRSVGTKNILDFWEKMNKVFGLIITEKHTEIDRITQKLIEEREVARKNKDFKKSDEMRKKIEAKGYIIEDAKGGYKLKKRGK
jgi:cysteinyl-tRNA synthetase